MNKLKSDCRIVLILSSICGMLIFGCASGPVTTQIDKSKNPVVTMPPQFQSPVKAIDSLVNSQDSQALKDHEASEMNSKMLKILLSQQAEVATELKATGQLLLRPGYSYEFDLETFCVNAGIERPVTGDGLFLGDMEGNAKSWLPTILRNYKSKGINQTEAQTLIWSLLSQTHFDQLNSENQKNILKLFPDAMVRFGNSVVEDQAKNFLLSQVPADLLSAKDQFDKYHEILQDMHMSFSEIEKTLSPIPSRTNVLYVGWLKHEDGYYIHLEANGYKQARIKIYAPEGLKANTYFQPTKHVALPGIGQRLALSSIVVEGKNKNVNQFIKNKTGVSIREALFILKHPLDAIKIHQAAQTAIQKTWTHFKSIHHYQDDNSDAFRHFVWAGLVANEIGPEKAKEYLDEHEDFPENEPAAKSMDLFNNNKGIEYSKQYTGQNFVKDLIQAGLDKIRQSELRWIK